MMILDALTYHLFVSPYLVFIQEKIVFGLFASDGSLNTHSGIIHDVLNVKFVHDVLNVINIY